MRRLPPALAATATPEILELLGEGPGRVLELGFAGIHAAGRAEARAGSVAEKTEGSFDVVIAPAGTDLDGIDATRIVLVDERGVASIAG